MFIGTQLFYCCSITFLASRAALFCGLGMQSLRQCAQVSAFAVLRWLVSFASHKGGHDVPLHRKQTYLQYYDK
jgi:hypothetical protein